jgi:hypothetical protein
MVGINERLRSGQYYAGKANVVTDALSDKSQVNLVNLITSNERLVEEMRQMNIWVGASEERICS